MLTLIETDALAAMIRREIRAALDAAPKDEWVSIPDAAARLGCSKSTIYNRIRSGDLQAQGVGKLRKVRL